MANSRGSDDALVTFTDRLLAGESPPADAIPADLAETVRQLQTVIAADQPPSATFRQHLADRIRREWDLHYRPPVRWWHSRRAQQALALVAMLVVVLTVTVVLSLGGSQEQPSLEGTAGGVTAGVVVGLAGLGGLAVVALLIASWIRRR